MNYEIHHGDCIATMRVMLENSVDSIITDPPYELGFMGKKWDATGIANSVEMWTEALRVLKPGGHLLAFSGSRTYHRMTCAIEDAGFEVRDQIMWVYGSGFPKSLDVSKAIDKAGGNPLAFRLFADAYAAAIAASRLTHADIDRALGIKSSSCYWARSDHRGGMPPRQHWEQVCTLLPMPSELSALYDEAERLDREVGAPASNAVFQPTQRVINAGTPVTEAAQQWQGWGTALKPAHEPICVARKPLIGTVAANVLQWGTGALNIDGCRVDAPDGVPNFDKRNESSVSTFGGGLNGSNRTGELSMLGRWPANLIHDGSDAADPLGEAARFFYCAKASKKDRNSGGVASTHPTVKPTDLMAYLCRLVTPPGGVVLDPFMGSGSTGKAAMREGFRFIGIDMTAEYIPIATARIQHALDQTRPVPVPVAAAVRQLELLDALA